MINFLKSFVNAFSAHSFIPLPYYEDEGDKYKAAFVPLIGVIIYHLLYWWSMLSWYRFYNDVVEALGMILIVIIVTGGRQALGFISYVDSIPTYKYRFRSWSESRDRGVLRFLLVIIVWTSAMANTYDYIFPLVWFGFIASRITVGLLSSIFNENSNQSKVTIGILVVEFIYLVYYVCDEYETLAICPIIATVILFLLFMNNFRRSTAENLDLLEDDYVVSFETAWIMSVAIISLIRSIG